MVWAAFFNFIAAFVFGTAVAKTMGTGLIRVEWIDPTVILAGLVGKGCAALPPGGSPEDPSGARGRGKAPARFAGIPGALRCGDRGPD